MCTSVLRPNEQQLALLSSFERRAFRLVDFVNTNPRTKQIAGAFLKQIGASWVYFCTRRLVHALGLRHLDGLNPERGLLLVSNHRSLFDQYVIACWLYRLSDLLQRIYFPVRSEFYYERPLGVFVSAAMSALAMYPPVFRDPAKRAFNTYSVQRIIQLLKEPGVVIGVHPEGKRNKGPDPYALLPAQPGIGKIILEARPTVLPIFINGLCNDIVKQVKGNFASGPQRGTPVVMVFGQPLDLSTYYAERSRLRTQKAVAEHVLDEIAQLGHEERSYRATLADEIGPVFHP